MHRGYPVTPVPRKEVQDASRGPVHVEKSFPEHAYLRFSRGGGVVQYRNRTGRAGRKGRCITLYKFNEDHLIKEIERATGNNFQRIGTPQPKDLVRTAAMGSVDLLNTIDAKILKVFKSAAEDAIDEFDGDAVKAVSATLALLTGFILGSLNKMWPWKQTVSVMNDATGKIIPFDSISNLGTLSVYQKNTNDFESYKTVIEKSISPFQYSEINTTDHQLYLAIGLMIAGFLTIFILEKVGAKKA